MKRISALLSLLLVWGCARPSTETTETIVLDLVDRFDDAAAFSETGRIDIGTPQARPHLTRNWSWSEKDGAGTSFVWGGPGASEIAFFTDGSRPLTVRFRCLPYREADGHLGTMAVSLNSAPLAPIGLQDGWREYELELTADRVQPGVNRLMFEYRWSSEMPQTEDERRGRRVAVAWDWIDFSVVDGGSPEADTGLDLLRLAPGSRVDYFFEAPTDAELVVETIVQKGEGNGTIVISSMQDGRPRQRLLEFDGWHRGEPIQGRRRQHRSLPLRNPPNRWPVVTAGGLVQLSLESTGIFELSAPRVVSKTPRVGSEIPTEIRPDSTPLEAPPLVLLYVIDAFRADHLGSINIADERTPGFATFVQDAVVFEKALAQSSWTKPTVASILTGQPPWTHGAQDAKDTLSADLDTLPERMRQIGYRTAAFSANGFISETFGFHHGFDHFTLMSDHDASAVELHGEAISWLANQLDHPVFLYLHSIDPHTPYDPAEPFRSRFLSEPVDNEIGSVAHIEGMARSRRQPEPAELEAIRHLYSAEIAYADQQFSLLVDELKTMNLYDPSLIVVMSDHGEEFYEHGSWTHGRTLHPEVLDVPLLIKFPHSWGAGIRIPDQVQQIDLLPTLEDLLEMAPSVSLPGHSLLCAVQQAATGDNLECRTSRDRPLFSSVDYYNSHWSAVTLGDWKLILPGVERLTGDGRLYDRRADRAEQIDLARDYPVQVGYLTSLIRRERRLRSLPLETEQVELDAETEERLRALGYLD